ncbi:HEAT repeat domain-containing protein [Saccharopolyspora shandongensis]|uniref:HEAT repeat domain-containing protein n=1 Tax=Saccharopolyspora shandongensis TaxID=418495 RepID=UPI0033D82EF2
MDQFESLPFPGRMRALSEHALALSESEYTAVSRALDVGGDHTRHIALHLAVVRRDLDFVERALADPALRPRAMAAAVRLPIPDSPLVELVVRGAPRDRVAVYGVLRRSRRRALADELIAEVHRRHGPGDAAALLPACSPEVVARWLPEVGAGVGVLHRLARTAPAAVAEYVAAETAACDGQELSRWLRRHRNLLALLATEEPLVVARVLRDQPRLCSMLTRDPRLAGALLSEPAELLRWDGRTLLRSLGYDGITLPAVAQRAIAALSVDQVANLLSWFGRGPGRASLLRALPVQVRRQVVELAHPGERLNATITAGELRELPASDRIELARRILAEGSSERSWRHLEITGVLPYDEAAAPLLEATSSHRYQERRVAWATLLTCAVAEHDPHAFTDALSAAKRAWHDQDVVRAAALRPVADAPAQLLSAVPLEVVREAVVATVESRDATRETFALASRWLARSLTSALARGLAQRVTTLQGLAARLHADPRSPGRFSAQHQVTAGPQLWAELRERVLHDARSSRYSVALRVAGLFGTNLASAPELDRLIGEIARTAPNPADAAAAARRWIADPATRDQRVGELVAHDPALGRADVLWQVVSTRRTDLLDRLLETGEPLPAVPPVRRGRWTPTQSAAVEAHAAAVAHGAEAGLRERESAAAFVTEPNTLTSIADTAPQPVAAAALIALGSADPEQALPVLLRHAGGPAGPVARAAVRALGKALDSLPDGLAVERLRPVLANGSVGAAKEAARLLVDRRPAGAVDELADAWAAARHDDVRAAVAAALVGFLGEDDRVPALVAEAIAPPRACATWCSRCRRAASHPVSARPWPGFWPTSSPATPTCPLPSPPPTQPGGSTPRTRSTNFPGWSRQLLRRSCSRRCPRWSPTGIGHCRPWSTGWSPTSRLVIQPPGTASRNWRRTKPTRRFPNPTSSARPPGAEP